MKLRTKIKVSGHGVQVKSKKNPYFILGWGKFSKQLAYLLGFPSVGFRKGDIVGVLLFRCSIRSKKKIKHLIRYSGAIPEQGVEGVAPYVLDYSEIDFAQLAKVFDARDVFRMRLLLNAGWDFMLAPTTCKLKNVNRFISSQTDLYSVAA